MDGGTWWATVHGGRCKSGMTERLHFHFSLLCIGEGNGNPLQCSCLENPRDRGAWWAAVYGVAQSRTRLKRLSSSSSLPEWIGFSGHMWLFRASQLWEAWNVLNCLNTDSFEQLKDWLEIVLVKGFSLLGPMFAAKSPYPLPAVSLAVYWLIYLV